MTYRVLLKPAANRALSRLPAPVVIAVLALIDGDLTENPRRVGKPLLTPLDGQYSARRGDYRVRYRIADPDVVVVLSVAHRRDAYLPR